MFIIKLILKAVLFTVLIVIVAVVCWMSGFSWGVRACELKAAMEVETAEDGQSADEVSVQRRVVS